MVKRSLEGHRFAHLRRFRRMAATVVVLSVATATLLSGAGAANAIHGREFGPLIDPYAKYQGASVCDPDPEPGVVSFKRIVLREYPWTGKGYIGRDCGSSITSEHQEGRAWDWMVSVESRQDRRAVSDLFDKLLKTDRHDNRHARARRLGIMYFIWNGRMWTSWDRGWKDYTGSNPHTDHVHFSFGWPGARKKTTFWNPEDSWP